MSPKSRNEFMNELIPHPAGGMCKRSLLPQRWWPTEQAPEGFEFGHLEDYRREGSLRLLDSLGD